VKDWTRVATAENPIEAGFLRGLLEAAGIECRLRNMELWTAAVETYFGAGARPSLWVPDRAADAARKILEQGAAVDGEPWTCGHCGERMEGQFSACWQCGNGRASGGGP